MRLRPRISRTLLTANRGDGRGKERSGGGDDNASPEAHPYIQAGHRRSWGTDDPVSKGGYVDAHARSFFEGLVADNLDVGRPDEVELIFTGKNERRGRPRTHPLTFKTKIVTRGVDVTVNAFYRDSRSGASC